MSAAPRSKPVKYGPVFEGRVKPVTKPKYEPVTTPVKDKFSFLKLRGSFLDQVTTVAGGILLGLLIAAYVFDIDVVEVLGLDGWIEHDMGTMMRTPRIKANVALKKIVRGVLRAKNDVRDGVRDIKEARDELWDAADEVVTEIQQDLDDLTTDKAIQHNDVMQGIETGISETINTPDMPNDGARQVAEAYVHTLEQHSRGRRLELDKLGMLHLARVERLSSENKDKVQTEVQNYSFLDEGLRTRLQDALMENTAAIQAIKSLDKSPDPEPVPMQEDVPSLNPVLEVLDTIDIETGDMPKKEIMAELDALGVKYDKKDKKEDLLKNLRRVRKTSTNKESRQKRRKRLKRVQNMTDADRHDDLEQEALRMATDDGRDLPNDDEDWFNSLGQLFEPEKRQKRPRDEPERPRRKKSRIDELD